MVPARGLGWPGQPVAPPPEAAGLHRGHAEPEGPELSDGPLAGGFSTLSEVDGLGWPQNMSNDSALASEPSAPVDPHGGKEAGSPGETLAAGDTAGSRTATDATAGTAATAAAAEVTEAAGTAAAGVAGTAGRRNGAGAPAQSSPVRVQQALSAAVSRETGALTTGRPSANGAAGNGLEDVMQGGTVAQDDGRAGGVVIPDVPQNQQDTPIARAAEAAVGVHGAGESHPWPRPGGCRVMTIANQKGGVGKTTTAVNLAASLSQHGARVLVVDLDPQGNASTALDVDHRVGTLSIYNTLVEDRPLADIVKPVEGLPGLYCAPATIDLAGAEIELVPLVARESRLARAVAAYDSSDLDYILIDCPPSLGLLTLNALVAAREVLIPIQCEYYALEGLEQLLRTVDLVKGHLNPELQISTILLTMYDGRTRLASQVADEVRSHFGDVVLQSIIPRSVRVSEAPSYGQSVITYDPGSSGSVAYVEAARELSQRHPQMAS
jgi:chromosome partitioning protein